MKIEKWYMNTRTGVMTDSHRVAVQWYSLGYDVDLVAYDAEAEAWTTLLRWVH